MYKSWTANLVMWILRIRKVYFDLANSLSDVNLISCSIVLTNNEATEGATKMKMYIQSDYASTRFSFTVCKPAVSVEYAEIQSGFFLEPLPELLNGAGFVMAESCETLYGVSSFIK